MTNEQILEKQVEALEKLNQLKQAVIDQLEAKVAKLEGQSVNIYGGGTGWLPSHSYGQWQCPVDGNPHQYPQMWNGTSPPCCSKCGQQATSWATSVTVGGGAGGAGYITHTQQGQGNVTFTGNNLPVHTSGYFQPIDADNVQLLATSNK